MRQGSWTVGLDSGCAGTSCIFTHLLISGTCEKWCHGVAGGRCSLSPPSLSTSEEVGQSQIVQIQGVLLVLPHLLHLDLALECTEANPFACRSWPRLWIPTSNSWRTGGWWNLESNRCYLEIWNSVWIRVWLQIAPNHPKPSTPRNQVQKSSKSNALFGVVRTSRAQAESGPWVVELTWNVLKPMIQCIHVKHSLEAVGWLGGSKHYVTTYFHWARLPARQLIFLLRFQHKKVATVIKFVASDSTVVTSFLCTHSRMKLSLVSWPLEHKAASRSRSIFSTDAADARGNESSHQCVRLPMDPMACFSLSLFLKTPKHDKTNLNNVTHYSFAGTCAKLLHVGRLKTYVPTNLALL